MFERTFDDGKYTLRHSNGTNLKALRHGEPWRDLTGDGMVLAMLQEVETLDATVAEQEALIKSLQAQLDAANRLKAHVEQVAQSCGWDPAGGEGAFECLQRTSYRQGWDDGRTEALNGGRRP